MKFNFLVTFIAMAFIASVMIACAPPSVDEMEQGVGVVIYGRCAVIDTGKGSIVEAIKNFEEAYSVKVTYWSFESGYDKTYINISW